MIKYTHIHKYHGWKARVICTDKQGEESYVVLTKNDWCNSEKARSYTQKVFNATFEELKPWHDCKTDDPVYVRMPGVESWLKRHFAGVDAERNPFFWVDGCTSFTSCGAIFRELAAECYPADQAPEHVVQCSVT
jgi:hypothetical protein